MIRELESGVSLAIRLSSMLRTVSPTNTDDHKLPNLHHKVSQLAKTSQRAIEDSIAILLIRVSDTSSSIVENAKILIPLYFGKINISFLIRDAAPSQNRERYGLRLNCKSFFSVGR
jgi:hypothetical protein